MIDYKTEYKLVFSKNKEMKLIKNYPILVGGVPNLVIRKNIVKNQKNTSI